MNTAELYGEVEALENYFGKATCPESPFSFQKVMEYDENEHYPSALLDILHRRGLEQYFLPAEFGGRAVNIHEGLLLYRCVSRRDPTTAACMLLSSAGFMPVWVAGTPEQKQYYTDLIKHGGAISWGLSEGSRGSDILQNETVATKVEGGYLLSGEKWPIGNATMAGAMTVFARTGKANAPNGFSLFVVEKNKLDRSTYSHLPRTRTLGLRALDLSGVRLDNAFVADSARIGCEGAGLEATLRASQMVRTMINTIAIGSADTALRLTYDFACKRMIFGQRVADIPYSALQLTESFCDILIADALVLASTRLLQAHPEQASVSSAVSKYFVPTLLEGTVDTLRVVLGARHYLRDNPQYEMFQKMLRDIAVVGFADGNTVVNLKNIVHQVQPITCNLVNPDQNREREAVEAMTNMLDLDWDAGPYRPQLQQMHSRGIDYVTASLPSSIRLLETLLEEASDPLAGRIVHRASALLQHGAGLARRISTCREKLGSCYGQSAEQFDFAKEFCVVYAAACCVHWFLHGTRSVTPGFRESSWLACALDRLWSMLYPVDKSYETVAVAGTLRLLETLYREERLISFIDARTAW